MTSRLLLLALLGACVPKTTTTTSPVDAPPVAVTPPVAPTPTAETPPPSTPATTATPTEPAPAAPSIAIAQQDALAQKVNDAVSMLTVKDPARAQRAIEILQGAQAEHPDVAAIHYNMGVAYMVLGQEAEARKAWTRATEVDPTFAKAWKNLGVASAASGRVDLALASFQSGIRYNAQDLELRVASVSALRQLKRYDEAIAEAKKALFINSKYTDIYTELAAVYLETSQLDLARFTLLKALAEIPGADANARVHAVLGEVNYRLGYTGDAIQSFQKALQLDPYHLPALLYLAGYYMDNRAWSDATPLLERAVAIAPKDAGIRQTLGVSYRGEKRFEDAIAAYNESLRLKPQDPEPHRNLAVLYGDYLKAYDKALASIEDYRRAGGGTAAELDGWIASIKKEQEAIRKKQEREERQRKEEAAERQKEAEGLFGPPADAPPPTPDGATPTPAPSVPAPEPAPTPPPEPVPSEPSPW